MNKSDLSARKKIAIEFAIQGITAPEIIYEEDIESDFEAIANDNRYNSSPELHSAPSKSNTTITTTTTSHKTVELRQFTSNGIIYADATTSVETNRLSVYDMVDIADVKKRPSRRIHLGLDDGEAFPSLFGGPVTTPTMLESWKHSPESHESLAYRLEQPAKKRKH
jgi:hypothetical protein